MNKSLPTRVLREHPDLNQLKRQARELRESFAAGDPNAAAEVNLHYRGADPEAFALHDAQLVLARAYGFESWPKLKAYVDGVTVSRLCDAVQQGDLEAVHDMLRRRPEIINLEWPGHGERRAIHVAVLCRNAALVRVLMQHGADARVGIWPHRDATSALTFAVERGYDDIAAIIREAEEGRSGAQQATADPEGWTPLHQAAGRLQVDEVGRLLTNGSDVNRRAAGEWTPLDYAASGWAWDRHGNPERFRGVADLLLAAGATLSSMSAVALGKADWVRARQAAGSLENPSSFDVFGPFGGLLSAAVRHDRPEMLALLLELGLDPDERMRIAGSEEVGYSWGMPLHFCAGSGRYAMAEMLLARGADTNGQVCASGTPVGHAYGRRDWEMVRLLERYGGVVYAANAGYYRDTELARRLFAEEVAGELKAGAVSQGNTLAEDLLGSAASGGDPEIVRMALARIDWGPDDPRWYWRLTDPLCFWNHMPGIPAGDPTLDRTTYFACFRLILARANPNLRPERFGQTVLHEVAAMRRHVTDEEVEAFASALLDAGARMDVRDDLLHSTPLGWACRWGRAGLVKLLVARGADVEEADAEPWARPRAWAEKMGHVNVLEVLRP